MAQTAPQRPIIHPWRRWLLGLGGIVALLCLAGIANHTDGDPTPFAAVAMLGAVALWWHTVYLVGAWFVWLTFIG